MHSPRRSAWIRPWAAAALAFGVAIALGAGPAGAAPAVDVYVYGKPLGETPIMQGKMIFLPLEPLLKIQGLPYTVTGQTWNIVTAGAPPPPPAEPSVPSVIVNGSACAATATIQNRIYVDVYAFEALVGAKVLYNKETGILDILKPTSKVTQENAQQAVKIAASQPPVLSSMLGAGNGPGIKKLDEQFSYWCKQAIASSDMFNEIYSTLQGAADAGNAAAQEQLSYFAAISDVDTQIWIAFGKIFQALDTGDFAAIQQSWDQAVEAYKTIIWQAPVSWQSWHETFLRHDKREIKAIGHMVNLILQKAEAATKDDQTTVLAVDKLIGDLGDEFHTLGTEEISLAQEALQLAKQTARIP